MSEQGNWSLLGWLAALLRELWSWVLLNLLLPGINPVPDQRRDRVVNSVSTAADSAEHPLERSGETRILDEHAVEGNEQGAEADVSDEFLSQLEQRTQQVKITLANLEAEKVRIETQIAQLQPIVPHYDALVAAERSLADAAITLEPAQPEAEDAPSETGGWSSDTPGGGEQQQNSGWSGSWNS
jgi:hypothetical protein